MRPIHSPYIIIFHNSLKIINFKLKPRKRMSHYKPLSDHLKKDIGLSSEDKENSHYSQFL